MEYFSKKTVEELINDAHLAGRNQLPISARIRVSPDLILPDTEMDAMEVLSKTIGGMPLKTPEGVDEREELALKIIEAMQIFLYKHLAKPGQRVLVRRDIKTDGWPKDKEKHIYHLRQPLNTVDEGRTNFIECYAIHPEQFHEIFKKCDYWLQEVHLPNIEQKEKCLREGCNSDAQKNYRLCPEHLSEAHARGFDDSNK